MDYTLFYLTPTNKCKYKGFNSVEEARYYMRKLLKKGNYHFDCIMVWDNGCIKRYMNQWEAQI